MKDKNNLKKNSTNDTRRKYGIHKIKYEIKGVNITALFKKRIMLETAQI